MGLSVFHKQNRLKCELTLYRRKYAVITAHMLEGCVLVPYLIRLEVSISSKEKKQLIQLFRGYADIREGKYITFCFLHKCFITQCLLIETR